MNHDQHVMDWDRACGYRARFGHYSNAWVEWRDRYESGETSTTS